MESSQEIELIDSDMEGYAVTVRKHPNLCVLEHLRTTRCRHFTKYLVRATIQQEVSNGTQETSTPTI
jgi:hypothetical protein